MSTPQSVVIARGGLAGAKAAEALREQGFDGNGSPVGHACGEGAHGRHGALTANSRRPSEIA